MLDQFPRLITTLNKLFYPKGWCTNVVFLEAESVDRAYTVKNLKVLEE